jgi:hypothetical protein
MLINTFPPSPSNLDSIPPLFAAAADDGDGACVSIIAYRCWSCIIFDDDHGGMFKDWLLIIEYSWLCTL